MFSKLRKNSKKDIRWLLDNYEHFLWENKIPCILFYISSPFNKPSLDFHKHFKTKMGPAILEF